MDENETKALQFLKEADKKSRSLGGGGGFLGGIFGGFSGKSDDACELYVKAANLFKMAKKWDQAGQSFVKSAEINCRKGDAKHEAASNYVDAATCYRKTDPRSAVSCLQKAAEIYTDMGRFTMAAKHHQSMAEIFENDLSDLDQAVYNYEKAADYFKGEESKSAANKCLLKVAQYAAELKQYRKAIDIYEEIGKAAVDNNLLKYTAKDYFFKAILCYLCMDLLDAQHALKRYDDLFPTFTDSREHKLLSDCILALEAKNLDDFTQSLRDYDKISRLDSWTTKMLLRVKELCGGEDNLGGENSDLL
uniref:Alpha-soluble NSF attachment protein n=1 Tax=Romanomermis culicivorax TaxID=13658 RepID=A0A915HV87_ROMCU